MYMRTLILLDHPLLRGLFCPLSEVNSTVICEGLKSPLRLAFYTDTKKNKNKRNQSENLSSLAECHLYRTTDTSFRHFIQCTHVQFHQDWHAF